MGNAKVISLYGVLKSKKTKYLLCLSMVNVIPFSRQMFFFFFPDEYKFHWKLKQEIRHLRGMSPEYNQGPYMSTRPVLSNTASAIKKDQAETITGKREDQAKANTDKQEAKENPERNSWVDLMILQEGPQCWHKALFSWNGSTILFYNSDSLSC